jgi:hypothetical protein
MQLRGGQRKEQRHGSNDVAQFTFAEERAALGKKAGVRSLRNGLTPQGMRSLKKRDLSRLARSLASLYASEIAIKQHGMEQWNTTNRLQTQQKAREHA